MNILTFNYEYPPMGGGGGVAHQLIAEEQARRHRVVVVTSAFRDLPAHEVVNGVEVHRVPVLGRRLRSAASLTSLLSYPVTGWRRGASLAAASSFDIVHSHFAVPTGPAGLRVARKARLPHVLSIHGGDIYDPSKRMSPHRVLPVRAVVRRVLRGSDAVVAQSEDTRANARRYYGVERPIDLIPLGIRVPEVPAASREELGLADGPTAITVGRLVPRKGLDTLLRILAEPTLRALHLVVVGSGPELEPLQRLSASLGLTERVRFTGFVSEERKWQLLRAADVYVSTSLHEGFGLCYVEAMAAGLPVVAPDHGGQEDFLEDGVTGAVTPAGQNAAVVRAMSALLDRPERMRAMGDENVERSRRFRIEQCAAAYEDLYGRLLERPAPAAQPRPPMPAA